MIAGLIVGIMKSSFVWGIGAWLLFAGVYFIPYIGSSINMATSLVEAILVYYLLESFNLCLETTAFFISLFLYFLLIYIHKEFGGVYDEGEVGYGWLFFETLFLSLLIHYMTNSIPLAVISFVLVIVVSFIPRIRVIGYTLLSIFAGISAYSIFLGIVAKKYAMIGGLCILIFSVVMYALAYQKLDYIGYKNRKEEAERLKEKALNIANIKREIYNKYPQLEKEYYYFFTSVCKDIDEREEFVDDWNFYLSYLNMSNSWMTFNDFFEQKNLFKYHFYNRDFAEKNKDCNNYGENYDNNKNNGNEDYTNNENESNKNYDNESDDEMQIIYFKGINSAEGLKKRYTKLMHMYHPDEEYGDNDACCIIQNEYEYLKKKFQNG